MSGGPKLLLADEPTGALDSHIKCLEELKAGNLEFRRAAEQTEQALDDFHLPELTYFREHFLPSFRLTLDEME